MKRFHQLIAKDIFNCLTTEEREELKTIREKHGISEEAYEKMKLTICSPELHEEISISRTKKHYLSNFFRYAALFVLPLSIAGYFLWKDELPQPTPPTVTTATTFFSEKPRPKEIQLTLANGETVQLTRAEKEVLIAPNIVNNGKMLKYQKDTILSEETLPAYNTITVPATGEFSLRLSDGTQVWLNEKTRLTYPIEFSQSCREIHLLEGEIYLEVAKDSQHPFIVYTPNGNIQVLGTHFNVRCVSSKTIETTLAEGKVKVFREQEEVILQPGQQAVIAEKISVAEVNVEEVICWKDHLFYFKDTELETILNKLACWYGFDLQWQSPQLKKKKFLMNIDKYASVKEILDALSDASEVCFRIQGKTVIVSQ